MSKNFMVLSFILITPMVGHAVTRDPTIPKYPVQTESPSSSPNERQTVSAIWISAKSRRATINGVSAKQGDTILNGIKVMRIRHNSVTIEQNGVIKTLLLIQRPYINKPGK
ncbi:MAG: hypothetical protein HOP23_09270 [Methylococcaceae bacterium]|nr:hypothetical protein [Methylococcaceae bacterium]